MASFILMVSLFDLSVKTDSSFSCMVARAYSTCDVVFILATRAHHRFVNSQ